MHQDCVHNSSSAWNHAALQRRRGTAAVNIIALLQSMIHILVGRCSHSSCGREHEPLLCLQKVFDISIKARAGKWEIRFWISSGPSGSFDALRLRPRTKTKLQASDTWESWGLNDEMHFSTSIIPNAKMFLLLRNITSYCNFCNWARAFRSSGGVGWDTGRDSQQFGWFANKAGDWDSVTSKMQRTSQ